MKVSTEVSTDFITWLYRQGITRPRFGPCPCCGTQEKAYCEFGCLLIDPMDFR